MLPDVPLCLVRLPHVARCLVRHTIVALRLHVFVAALWCGAAVTATEPIDSDGESTAADQEVLTFEQHVRPILKAACFQCHGEEQDLRGGLDLRLVRLMRTGGESGPAVVPGDDATSLIWRRIEADEMPEGRKKLVADQKSVIRRWIEQGAATARPEPANVEEAQFTLEELSHWAFQPVTAPDVPQSPGYEIATPIDGFIAERLAEHGLPFSPPADARPLVRRATFDLTGLPPAPHEVDEFVEESTRDPQSAI